MYLVDFEQDSIMKVKNYLLNCKVRNDKRQPIIVITYNEYMFLSNNDIYKVRTWIVKIFLWSKNCRQKIIMSEFFSFLKRFNLFFVPENLKKRDNK